jgi:hypothetical protein
LQANGQLEKSMNIKLSIMMLALGLALVTPRSGSAQSGQPPADPNASQDDPAKSAPKQTPSTLEEMLGQALKQNSDILVAEAKLRQTQAEYQRVKSQTAAEIGSLVAKSAAVHGILKECKRRLDTLYRLRAKGGGIVSDIEIGDAEVSVAKYGGDALEMDTRLAYLLGMPINDIVNAYKDSTSPEALEKIATKNADVMSVEAKIRLAELEVNRVRQQVLGKIAGLRAEVEASRTVLKEYTKRLDTMRRLAQDPAKRAVSDMELSDAQIGVSKLQAELASKEAELAILIGTNFVDPSRGTPPILKTYTIQGDSAQAIAKSLQAMYAPAPTLRLNAIGKNQLLVYAPKDIHAEIARYLEDRRNAAMKLHETESAKLRNVEQIRKALAIELKVNLARVSPKQVMEIMQTEVLDGGLKGVNFLVHQGAQQGDLLNKLVIHVNLAQPVTLAALMQLIEDEYPIRFIVRDYGIVAVHVDFVPAGALMVRGFVE